ncbi:MAG: hypothetical protein KF795_01895 [Labilithrix sp.]|nr:hypothetical protein [Labilithrix sp.]
MQRSASTAPCRVAFFFVLATLLFAGHSRALPPDPAARGLDVFIHAATDAAPGGTIELTVEAFGFATVTDARPLPNAIVEAGWDPESLDGAAAPPTVTAKTDPDGRARLAVVVPPGRPGALSLLVGARHGSHTRTHSVAISRSPAMNVELHVADARVVPTSTISAWARVSSIAGKPLAGAPLVVSLLEGGVARHKQRLVSDRGGIVMARVPIPRIDEPVWRWTLRVEADAPGAGAASIELVPREETPGAPTLEAQWIPPTTPGRPDTQRGGVLAGDRVLYALRLRDATGQPLVDHPLRWWIGPKGTNPPSTDDEWQKLGKPARTDGAGSVSGAHDAPTLVKASGTALQLVAEAVVEGHALSVRREIAVGVPTASAELLPEAGTIVPGLSQRVRLRVLDGHGDGVAATFKVTGDGLSTSVTTDANGEGELTWDAPSGVGATRNVGPCAGGVAAAVTIRQEGAAKANERDGFVQCVSIDRDAEGIVRVEPTVARPGDKVKVTVHRTRTDRRSWSAVMRAEARSQAVATWLAGRADGTASGEMVVPADAGDGIWAVSVALPDGARAARVASAALLVVPKVAPLLTAKRVGGRAAPGGKIEIEAVLSDGHGHGLPGAVSAVVVDAFGGGDARVAGLDTRSTLCRAIGVDAGRCTATLEGEPSTEALRRALLSRQQKAVVSPVNDPGEHASTELKKAFAEVLRSLEGAVFEATKSPQTLLDVRRKDKGRWVFNPEMFTLVTDAMDEPPMTPGGEALTLSDLSAVDPQVTFDNVARRVTRLKLFRVLSAVRAERSSRGLDPDEPMFKDPNALVRRLVRSGALAEDTLLDPWGGTIQFVKSQAPPVPFLSVARGFELRAPGPDGLVDTADDVRDPFARVLRSRSPYANAVDEDRLVDAKWDMVVSEDTVRAWQELFEELTGTQLGGGGLGLGGVGEGGGGRGEGIGLGSVGTIGHGRGSAGISTGDAFWTAPLRTDGEGRVKLAIPLGDVETTWRIALVAVPDGLEPASTTLDVASEAVVSARVDAGARWVAGDVVETNVTVRNRTNAAVRATVTAAAEGAIELDPKAAPATVEVPARGARQVRVRVTAKRAGGAALVVTTRSPGVPDDVLRHTWDVAAPGERRALTQTAWVDGERELGIALDHGYAIIGEPRLVLERGYDDAVAAALDSLEPERQTSAGALVDALEASLRIERWATQRSTPRHRAIAAIAKGMAERSLGRFEAYAALDESSRGANAQGAWTLRARVRALTKRSTRTPEERAADASGGPFCPPLSEDALDAEPTPSPDLLPCWGAYVSNTTRMLEASLDAGAIASGVLALAERPHRATSARQLVDQLRRVARLQPTGDIDGPGLDARATRALVYAALLRAQKLGYSSASQETLFGKLAALRDVTGGYGSSEATLAVVRSLLASQLEGHGATRARVRVMRPGQGVLDRRVDVPANGFVSVPLPPGALDVQIETEGPGLVARLERPVLRAWTRPPPPNESPVNVEVVWPAEARAGSTQPLRVMLRQDGEVPSEVDVRVPLPPGVKLAAPTNGVRELQGVLAIRQSVARTGSVIEVPLRFGLGGRVTVPEASARLTRRTSAPATAPARTLVVR